MLHTGSEGDYAPLVGKGARHLDYAAFLGCNPGNDHIHVPNRSITARRPACNGPSYVPSPQWAHSRICDVAIEAFLLDLIAQT
jgi:hypothetical protein